MFRAISCSSSGGQTVLLQHLISSLSVSSYSEHQLRADLSPLSNGALKSCLLRVTSDVVTIQFDLLKMSMILLKTCRGLLCNIHYYIINKLCIKLVIETSLLGCYTAPTYSSRRTVAHFGLPDTAEKGTTNLRNYSSYLAAYKE